MLPGVLAGEAIAGVTCINDICGSGTSSRANSPGCSPCRPRSTAAAVAPVPTFSCRPLAAVCRRAGLARKASVSGHGSRNARLSRARRGRSKGRRGVGAGTASWPSPPADPARHLSCRQRPARRRSCRTAPATHPTALGAIAAGWRRARHGMSSGPSSNRREVCLPAKRELSRRIECREHPRSASVERALLGQHRTSVRRLMSASRCDSSDAGTYDRTIRDRAVGRYTG